MPIISIDLTDEQFRALEYVAQDPTDWAVNAVTERARIAGDDIVALVVRHCLDSGVTLPATRAAVVDFAYAHGIVKTAAQRSAEELAQRL